MTPFQAQAPRHVSAKRRHLSRTRRQMLAAAVLTLGMLPGAWAADDLVREVAGVRFPPTVAMDGLSLKFNGAGLRSKMFIKVYAVALYLPQPLNEARPVMAADLPHRLRLVMLRDLDASKLADALSQGMLDGQAAAKAEQLRPRVKLLAQAMLAQPDLRRGEVLEIEYRPAQGTRVLRGGQALGTDIPGADFNEAMLGIWLGEHPSDDKLKANLLGRSS